MLKFYTRSCDAVLIYVFFLIVSCESVKHSNPTLSSVHSVAMRLPMRKMLMDMVHCSGMSSLHQLATRVRPGMLAS